MSIVGWIEVIALIAIVILLWNIGRELNRIKWLLYKNSPEYKAQSDARKGQWEFLKDVYGKKDDE